MLRGPSRYCVNRCSSNNKHRPHPRQTNAAPRLLRSLCGARQGPGGAKGLDERVAEQTLLLALERLNGTD